MGITTKITQAKALLGEIAEQFPLESCAIAWTGGKDSTVALHLWRTVLAEQGKLHGLQAISLDTGYKFPEIIEFRNSLAAMWSVNLHVVHPQSETQLPLPPPTQGELACGAYTGAAQQACCFARKIQPLCEALQALSIQVLLTGIRADESVHRAQTQAQEIQHEPPHRRVHPVLAFSEMDIWAYTSMHDLPHCSLYNQGYRSLGCMPCTTVPRGMAERSGRDQDKEDTMESLRALGYF